MFSGLRCPATVPSWYSNGVERAFVHLLFILVGGETRGHRCFRPITGGAPGPLSGCGVTGMPNAQHARKDFIATAVDAIQLLCSSKGSAWSAASHVLAVSSPMLLLGKEPEPSQFRPLLQSRRRGGERENRRRVEDYGGDATAKESVPQVSAGSDGARDAVVQAVGVYR